MTDKQLKKMELTELLSLQKQIVEEIASRQKAEEEKLQESQKNLELIRKGGE